VAVVTIARQAGHRALHVEVITMDKHRPILVAALGAAVLLAGCATPPPPDPTAEVPHCYKTNKGRVIACTPARRPA
jgi:hypothetical protein